MATNQDALQDGQPRRRRFDVVSLETLDLRVTALEGSHEQMRDELAGARREIQANTRLTEEIHGNTADIVEVMSDLKVFIKWAKRLWKPAVFLAGMLGAAFVYFKTGERHWPK